MNTLSILTLNVAIQQIKMLGISCYCPVKYVPERLDALPGKLLDLDADLVCLQEIFHAEFQQVLYSRLKHKYKYIAGLDTPGLRLRLGSELLILSKFPLTNTSVQRFRKAALEEWFFTNKGFMQVCITVSDSLKFNLLNIHTTAGGLNIHPENPYMEKIRSDQINQLIEHIRDDSPFLLVGDLNAGPEASMVNYRQLGEAGLTDSYQPDSSQFKVTWDKDNQLVKIGREYMLPSQRIDHMFLNKHARNILNPRKSEIVLTDNCINIMSQRNIPISDHYGLMTTFEYE